MLNGHAHALRPALTAADRQRYQQYAPQFDPVLQHAAQLGEARAIRADLIEDKIAGAVIGSACVLRIGSWHCASLHLQAMHDGDDTRGRVLQLLKSALPRLRNGDEPGRDDIAAIRPSDVDTRRELGAQLLEALGIPDDYAQQHQLSWVDEPSRLHYAGRDYVARTLWLQHSAMQAWQAMRRSADESGVRLEAVSGFRSIAYQAGILRRKLARGMPITEILAINTAPGYSEHHSGRAIDIGTPGCPPAETIFETTTAFTWLQRNAARFGFRMSYPRGNPHGVIYEPWHWYFQQT